MNARRLSCDVLVVGAGPAGLAAAAAARECGANVICLDLFGRAGGQYHMQPAVEGSRFERSTQVEGGRAAEKRCRDLGVRFLLETEVFWAEPGFTVYARHGVDAVTVTANSIVAATGAMERPIPFEGWTLPGVIGAGAAQRLIKANGTPPGRNVVLAGTGPFLLAVAQTLATAGLSLRAFVERQRPGLGALSPFLSHPGRLPEAIGLLRALKRTGAKLHTGHAVLAALGDGRVETVRLASIDANGKPDTSRAFTIDGIDCLAIGHGFQPGIDFTTLLQAKHAFDADLGGWHCVVDAKTQATSVENLFAAGETTGIGGSIPARLSGRLAGFHAARAAGKTTSTEDVAELRKSADGARAFAKKLATLFPFPSTMIDALPQDEIVCRCEDVTRGAIEAAIDDGATDAFSVKMWTRAGMGPCQGRMCGTGLAHIVAARTGQSIVDAGYNRPHMPLRPVPLSTVEAALALKDTTCPTERGQDA